MLDILSGRWSGGGAIDHALEDSFNELMLLSAFVIFNDSKNEIFTTMCVIFRAWAASNPENPEIHRPGQICVGRWVDSGIDTPDQIQNEIK